MSPQKRITKNSEAAHTAVVPTVPLTSEQIAAEEPIKDALVKKLNAESEAAQRALRGTKPVAPVVSPEDAIARLSMAAAEAEAVERADARDHNRAITGPKVEALGTRLNAAKTTMAELRAAHLDAMVELAGLQVGALIRAYAFKVTPGSAITGRDRLALLQRTAETAATTLRKSFEVASDAVARARQSASAEIGSQELTMALNWLRSHVAIAEEQVTAARQCVANATTLREMVAKDFVDATKVDNPVPLPQIDMLAADPIQSLFSRAARRLGV